MRPRPTTASFNAFVEFDFETSIRRELTRQLDQQDHQRAVALTDSRGLFYKETNRESLKGRGYSELVEICVRSALLKNRNRWTKRQELRIEVEVTKCKLPGFDGRLRQIVNWRSGKEHSHRPEDWAANGGEKLTVALRRAIAEISEEAVRQLN